MTSLQPATRIDRTRWLSAASQRPAIWSSLQVMLIVLFVGWRGISLGADPPADFIPQDVGFQIDEGYKTLSPRNLALFGVTQWNQADGYDGWMDRSPVTQWPFYFSFRSWGVERESARMVNILFFGAFLIAAAVFLNRRGGSAIALAGIILLGTDMALFNFSRVGIFEIAVCLFIYTGVFIASSLSATRRLAPLAVLAVTAIVAALGVKASSLLYLMPPLALALLIVIFESRARRRTKVIASAIAIPIGLALLYLTSDIWRGRIDLDAAMQQPATLVFHPIYLLSPLAITLAYLATLDIYLKLGLEEFRRNRYLLSIVSIALFVPVMLAAVLYNPPRYSLPVVPAALLVAVEWLRLYEPKLRGRMYQLTPIRLGVIGLILLPLAASLTGFASTHLIAALPFVPQGEDPGFGLETLGRLYPIPLFITAVVTVVLLRRRMLHAVVPFGIMIGLIVHVAISARSDLQAVFQPKYATDAIQERLTRVVAEGESIGGDWAPYFALGTGIPALYMHQKVNTRNIEAIRPTYFLNSNTDLDERTLGRVEAAGGISIGDPIPLGTVFHHDVELLRLSYSPRDESPAVLPD